MKNSQEHSNEENCMQENALEGFCTVQDKTDFLDYLNRAQVIIYGDKSREITMRSLNYYAYSSNAKQRYVAFQIPKKDGTSRTINAPCKGLKVIQKALSVLLESLYVPNMSAMGFVNGRSIVDNAKAHLGKSYIYNIDLKDFFPSITSGRIYARLQVKPYGFGKEIASLIADICCQKDDNNISRLPQGAPTSPIVTNIVCEKLDYKLQKLAKSYHLTYTRYADDITFSGNKNIFNEGGKFCKRLRQIIENEEHFCINEKKTRLCQRGGRMEVTGLTINSKLNTSRKYMRQIRTMLHNWETLGYEKAQEIFIENYTKTNTKNLNSKGTHYIENILAGKLMFLSMVKGKEDVTYNNLQNRYLKLMQDHFVSCENGVMSVSDILDAWERDGLDSAMMLYEEGVTSKTEETEKQDNGAPNKQNIPSDGDSVIAEIKFSDEDKVIEELQF